MSRHAARSSGRCTSASSCRQAIRVIDPMSVVERVIARIEVAVARSFFKPVSIAARSETVNSGGEKTTPSADIVAASSLFCASIRPVAIF